MREIWKDIKVFNNKYSVSNFGRIKRNIPYFKSFAGRFLKFQKNHAGYLVVSITLNRILKTMKVHNIVAMEFIGERLKGKEINHKDGNKENNYLSNLEYVTRRENVVHAFTNGLNKGRKGEECGNSTLTNKQVMEIRNKYNPRIYSSRKLAKEFNVTQPTILRIIHKKTWSHI